MVIQGLNGGAINGGPGNSKKTKKIKDRRSPSGPTAGLLYVDWNFNGGVLDSGEATNEYDGTDVFDKAGGGGTAPSFVNSPTPAEGTYCIWIDGFSREVFSDAAYILPDGDWTIRFPFRQLGSPAAARRRMMGVWVNGSDQSWWITKESDDTILFQVTYSGTTVTTICDSADNTWSLTADTWHDLTLQRNGSQVTMVIDDTVQSVGTMTGATRTPTSATWDIGSDNGVASNRAWKGYIDATIITEGAAYSEIVGDEVVTDSVTMPAIGFITI
jgi:hypothetical protein